jgi:hypothetical protein
VQTWIETSRHICSTRRPVAPPRARDFGIDLTLTLQRLRLTPEERLDDLQRVMRDLEEARKSAKTFLRKTR